MSLLALVSFLSISCFFSHSSYSLVQQGGLIMAMASGYRFLYKWLYKVDKSAIVIRYGLIRLILSLTYFIYSNQDALRMLQRDMKGLSFFRIIRLVTISGYIYDFLQKDF